MFELASDVCLAGVGGREGCVYFSQNERMGKKIIASLGWDSYFDCNGTVLVVLYFL